MMTTEQIEKQIADRYKDTGDYKEMCRAYNNFAKAIWDNTTRKNYQGDLWYTLNRNEICLEMLGDLCVGKRVLSVGGGQWSEKKLLEAITAREIVRTDLIADDGVIEADAAKLPFSDSSFDVMICRELIEHVPDEQAVYSEIKRVITPHGYLLITTPNAYNVGMDSVFHVRAYSPVGFIAELQEHGFTVIKKRGNVPNIFQGLMTFSDADPKVALDDFKEIDRLTRDYENRYYLSTQLFVLCRKGAI
jgi:SAM-dependent methyltransferase